MATTIVANTVIYTERPLTPAETERANAEMTVELRRLHLQNQQKVAERVARVPKPPDRP